MLIKAILIIDNEARIDQLSPHPAALTQVVGRSILEHVANHLRRSGITEMQAVARESLGDDLVWACGAELREASATGVDVAVVIDAAHYAEVDWESAIAHHLYHSQRLTPVRTSSGEALRAVVVTPALISDAFDAEFWTARALPYRMQREEYFVQVSDPQGLRQLAADALHGECSLDIHGQQVRPGIWIGARARIERGARLVAPVYVGSRSRVRAGAVITRGSTVEQHCLVDCGTVVEDATLLPFTELGPGLDARHAIVGERVLFSLQRAVAVPIADGKIVRQRPRGAVARVLDSATTLAAFLPQSIAQSLRKPQLPASAPALSGTAACTELSMEQPEPRRVGKFAPGLAVVRRYGNE